jgi:hypothetical protein
MSQRISNHLFLSVLAIFLTLALAQPSSAEVLYFDDLPGGGVEVPNGYGGFNWNSATQVGSIEQSYYGSGNGYYTGAVSGDKTVYNFFGDSPTNIDWASTGAFDYTGAYWTAAWDDTQTLSFNGFLNDNLLYSSINYQINENVPVWIELNWAGITRLQIINSDNQWVMDNFTFNELGTNPVPEPSTVLLLGIGLIGMAGIGRKTKK